ncbi:MAG: hypothetical protein ACKOWF_17780 [Chloroflexota bacterium]
MGMTMGNRRMRTIARGLLVVAALALLPLAGLGLGRERGPRRVVARASSQDSLWAGRGQYLAACANPSSPASLAGCFSPPVLLPPVTVSAMATDGVNVYYATEFAGAYSCPIAALGANCTHIMAGPWPPTVQKEGNSVNALAAYDGQIWIGQENGQIYRCAANIPYASQGSAPPGCTLLDDAGQRDVMSLLLANGRLYAGLAVYGLGEEKKKQGILWSCDPQAVNACENLDYYGKTYAVALAAGGGYLWAGLENGILWRCDLNAANACANWDTAGYQINSLSYDGEGTIYAAVYDALDAYGSTEGAIWSCPTAAANQCSNLISGINGASVAAGDGSVFSSTSAGLNFGTSAFTATSDNLKLADLLYVPAGGVTGVGGVLVKVLGGKWTDKLGKRCEKSGKGLNGIVKVTGPFGNDQTVAVNLCALAKGGRVKERVDLLEQGIYTVQVETTNAKKQFSGSVTFTVETDTTGGVKVRLARAGAGT